MEDVVEPTVALKRIKDGDHPQGAQRSARLQDLVEQLDFSEREALVRLIAKANALEDAMQSLHSVRSMAQLVTTNLAYLHGSLHALLAAANEGGTRDRAVIEDFREVLRDAALAAERVCGVAEQGLELFSAHSALGPSYLPRCLKAAGRLVAATHGREVELGNLLEVEVRPPIGEIVQVLTNLMRNCLQATQPIPEGRVWVECWASATMAFVRVEDNGPESSETHSERLFSLIVDEREPESAVGLHICRRLVQRWNGIIEVGVSEAGGRSFTVGIPTR
jgi:signal transduction histidine kinase